VRAENIMRTGVVPAGYDELQACEQRHDRDLLRSARPENITCTKVQACARALVHRERYLRCSSGLSKAPSVSLASTKRM